MKKGMFIVVDGIDGSGKSEIVRMLRNYLSNKKYEVLKTREPTDGKYGRKIREMLKKEKDPKSNSAKMAEFFVEDRKEHMEKEIEPFLSKSNSKINIVLCDRYYYSTIAFQGAQGLDVKGLIAKNKDFRRPNIAFILDIEPSVALKRIEYRRKEKFEQLEFMKKIKKNFLALPKLLKDNIKIIDASKPLKDVFESVRKEVDRILN